MAIVQIGVQMTTDMARSPEAIPTESFFGVASNLELVLPFGECRFVRQSLALLKVRSDRP